MTNWKDVDLLIVDDEPDICDILVSAFESKGARVASATNGKEAFEHVKDGNVKVVVTDVRMPGGSGIELLQRIRESSPRNPIVFFMTGFADITAEEAFSLGVDGIFSKPFEYKSIIQSVERSLVPAAERYRAAGGTAKVERKLEAHFPSLEAARESHGFELGRGGFYLACGEDVLRAGQRVAFDVRFDTGALPQLSGTGIVRWARRGTGAGTVATHGIEVVEVAEGARETLAGLMQAVPGKSFIPKA